MKAIRTIAKLTFKEAIRNRILYLLLFFALFLVSSSWLIGKLTIGDELKIINDLSISSIHFFSVLITIFIGIGLIFQEMQKRTIFMILTKPVERYHFLLGKFCGLALTLLMVIGILACSFYLVLLFKKNLDLRFLIAFLSIYMECLIIGAIGIIFSSFSTPLLSGILTLAFFLMGHLTDSLLMLKERLHSEMAGHILSVLFYLLPNLELFNVRAQLVHQLPLPPSYFFNSISYWLVYLIALLTLAITVFEKKDLT